MWTARFESVNYRVTVWLNGRSLGTHEGAYLPFELRLPRGFLKRTGVNRLVLRVDSRRTASDFPPAKFDDARPPARRLVELRRHPARGLPARDRRHRLRHGRRAPRPAVRDLRRDDQLDVRVRNAGLKSRRVTVTGRFGARAVKLGTVALGPKRP